MTTIAQPAQRYKPAFKVAGSSPRRSGVSAQREEPKNPWEKWYAWYPKRVKGKWYFNEWIYRMWVLGPGGGTYKYGNHFDYLGWKP